MEQIILDFIKGFDLHDIITIGFFWYFLNKKIENIKTDLSKDIQELDKRLCRVEGALMNKECCLLKNDEVKQKAE